jgi:hypothetical protein
MEDFNCISELGKFSRDKESDFMTKVTNFFFIIATAAAGKPNEKPSHVEVIDHCSKKYREMIKYNTNLDRKREIMLELVNLTKTAGLKSSVACLSLLYGIIKDQSERYVATSNYTYNSSNTTNYTGQNTQGY